MKRSLIGIALAMLALAGPAIASAQDEESPWEVPIQIEVAPSGEQPAGTVTAWLTTSGPAGDGRYPVALYVADARGTGEGWTLEFDGADGLSPAVVRYVAPTLVLAGQPVEPGRGPRDERLSIGLAGEVPARVLAAAPGAGAGSYRFHFEVEFPAGAPEVPATMVLTLPSAP